MQPYERYALVALLFLIVLVAVVALWDDGSSEEEASPRSEVALVDESSRTLPGGADSGAAARTGAARAMPISGQDERGPSVSRASTRRTAGAHGVEPIRKDGRSEDEASRAPARAQSAAELSELPKTVPIHGRSDEKLAIQNSTFTTRRKAAAGDVPTTGIGAAAGARPPAGVTPSAARSGDITGAVAVSAEPGTKERKVSTTPKSRTYVVKSGDVLSRIAKRELGDEERWVEIASLNGLSDPDKIFEDMKLQLPARSTAPSSTPAASIAAPAGTGAAKLGPGERRYQVASGEAISTVLERELGTYKRSIGLFVALNPGIDPNSVRAGQTVILPALSAVPGGAPSGSRAKGPKGKTDLDTSLSGSRVASAQEARPARARTSQSTESEFVVR